MRKVGAVGSQMTLINENNEVLGFTKYPHNHQQIIKLLEFQNCLGHPSVMFRRSVFEKVGGYRSQFTGAEDYDLWLRIAKVANLHNLADPLTRYRISNHQFTKRRESNQGIVETSVRLASLGYREVFTQPIDNLETINRIVLDRLKEFDYLAYRNQKSAYFVNRAYSLKRKSKRYSFGIIYILMAFIYSPLKLLGYIYIKFLESN
jgi:hypothetical protein